MRGRRLAFAVALGMALAGAGLAELRPQLPAVMASNLDAAQMQMDMPEADQGVPAYHAYALKPPFPATQDPKNFDDALSRNVYSIAAKIRPVLYQQPCYCYCDRHAGHKSLLDCYVGTHGSECDICQKEAIFAYLQTKKGKTPVQIRNEIIHGDWKSVDLRPYVNSWIYR